MRGDKGEAAYTDSTLDTERVPSQEAQRTVLASDWSRAPRPALLLAGQGPQAPDVGQ